MNQSPPTRIAILGGGIAGLTAAWQLTQQGHPVTLFEATPRLGGTLETIHRDGFTIETGPDGWITEKPSAAQLARDLGLADELIPSNDATRVTYILVDGRLEPMPPGMRMMVPTDLVALDASPLFSAEAKAAYAAEPTRAAELQAAAPAADESIATFVERHFGPEVLRKIAGPLLSGVFGGDVRTLSVHAVMPAFVQMEREHGSLITALQRSSARPAQAIFTTLTTGTQTLIDRMAATFPADIIRLRTPVIALDSQGSQWRMRTAEGDSVFDHVILATPAHVTADLLAGVIPGIQSLLPQEASSAVIAALAFTEPFPLPPGFGFLVPAGEPTPLFAATFVDQKYPHRAPAGTRLLRAFFGGPQAHALATEPDTAIAALAHRELARLLGPLPEPAFHVVRHWPRSLPQYAVGHAGRIAQIHSRMAAHPTLHLLGNAYHGVGIPDLIQQARTLAQSLA